MNESINLDAWIQDGEKFWASIQEHKLIVLPWNNPWLRMGIVGIILIAAGILSFVMWKNIIISVIVAFIALPFIFAALRFYLIGRNTGGLYIFFSDEGFGVGCEADRIFVPYTEMELPDIVSPSTVNENYIVLPIKTDPQNITIQDPHGQETEWNKSSYARGILSVELCEGTLIAKSKPNEILVQLFSCVYPLAMYLNNKNA